MPSLPQGSVALGTLGTHTLYTLPGTHGDWLVYATGNVQALADSTTKPQLITGAAATYLVTGNSGGAALLATDGTSAGTTQLATGTSISYDQASLGRDYFTVTGSQTALYVSNGTTAGTTLVASAPASETFQLAADLDKTTASVIGNGAILAQYWIDGATGAVSTAGNEFAWNGASGGVWNSGANWRFAGPGTSPGVVVPASNASATISATGASMQTVSGFGTIAYLTTAGSVALAGAVSAGAIGETSGTLQISTSGSVHTARATLQGGLVVDGTLTAGTALFDGAATDLVASGASAHATIGTLIIAGNYHTVNLNGGASLQVGSLVMGSTNPQLQIGAGILVDATSTFEVGTLGHASVGVITIDPGATMAITGGFNAILSGVVNNGTLALEPAAYAIGPDLPFLSLGSLSGTGSVEALSGGGFNLLADLSGSEQVTLADGATGTLGGNILGSAGITIDGASFSFASASETVASGATITLEGTGDALSFAAVPAASFAGTIAGFGVADILYLPGSVTGATLTGSTLALLAGTLAVGTLNVIGNLDADRFVVLPDGAATSELLAVPITPSTASAGSNGDTYVWSGPAGGDWNAPANWADQTTGATATVAPGARDNIVVAGTAANAILLGDGHAANATLSGTVALTDALTLASLTQGAGLIEVATLGTLVAGSATLGGGLTALGAGASARLGAVTLTGTATILNATSGGAWQAASVTLAGTSTILSTDATSSSEIGNAGGAAAGVLTVDPGATLTVSGTGDALDAPLVDNGLVQLTGPNTSLLTGTISGTGEIAALNGGSFTLSGDLGGSATLALADGASASIGGMLGDSAQATLADASLTLGGGTSAGSTITLGGHATLTLDNPAAMAGVIAHVDTTDTILLAGLAAGSVNQATDANGTLVFGNASATLGTLALAGGNPNDTYLIIPGNAGTTELLLYPATVQTSGASVTISPDNGSLVPLATLLLDPYIAPTGTIATLTVAAPGTLSLGDGDTVGSLVLLAGADVTTQGNVTAINGANIESGATLSASGTIDGAITNNGMIDVAGSFEITGALSGTGTIDLATGASLTIDGAMQPGPTIAYATGAPGTITLGDPGGSIDATITNVAPGDRIEFATGWTITDTTIIAPGTAEIDYTANGVAGSVDLDAIIFAGTASEFSFGVDSATGNAFVQASAPSINAVVAQASAATLDVGGTIAFTLEPGTPLSVDPTNGTPYLELSNGGTAAYAGTDASGDLLFGYTVADGADTVDLKVTSLAANGANITDASSLTLDVSGVGSVQGADTKLVISTASPTLSALTATAASPYLAAGGSVSFTLSANRPLTVDTSAGAPTITLSNGGTATYASTSASGALLFSYTASAGSDTADLLATALAANGASIADSLSRPLTTTELVTLAGANTHLAILTVQPTPTLLTSAASASVLGAGATATFTLTATSALSAATGGTPDLTLSNGGTAAYTGTDGNGRLRFAYTVAAGAVSTADLLVTGLALNGASITDPAGNAMASTTLTLAGDDTHLRIATVAPTITAVTSAAVGGAASPIGTGQRISFTLTPSAPLTISGSPTLTLNDGGVASYAGKDGSGDLLFAYTAIAGQNTTDLKVTGLLLNGAVITDAGANPLATSLASLSGADSHLAVQTSGATTVPAGGSITTAPGFRSIRIVGSAPTTVSGGVGGNDVIVGGGGALTYVGAAGNATVTAGDAANVIVTPKTGGGTYDVTVGGGANLVAVGSGNLALQTGNGNNTIYTPSTGGGMYNFNFGSGANVVDAESGTFSVSGSGSDQVYLGARPMQVSVGGSGGQTVIVGSGAATISPVSGNVSIWGAGTGVVSVQGGTAGGHITFIGNTAAATVNGGADSMLLFGGTTAGYFQAGTAGNSLVIGDAPGSFLQGGGNGDLLWSITAGETVAAGAGNESLFGSAGDQMNAGPGSSVLVSEGSSTINVGRGNSDAYVSGGGETVAVTAGQAGGSMLVLGFDASLDTLSFNGYGSVADILATETNNGGAQPAYTQFNLKDGTVLTLWGVASVGASTFGG